MKTKANRTVVMLGIFASFAVSLAVLPASAQAIICCSENINVGGGWTGSSRLADCQGYFNSAPTAILRRMCQQRQSLSCLNTSRCNELPPEEAVPRETRGSPAALPPNPDRDGLADGFGAPPLAPSLPPPGGLSTPRLVYLIMGAPRGGKPITAFTVYLDRAACLIPIAANNQPSQLDVVKHVVRGRIARSDGRVRIEAEASEIVGSTKLGPVTGEAEGEDAAAVAKATRAVMENLKLVCAR